MAMMVQGKHRRTSSASASITELIGTVLLPERKGSLFRRRTAKQHTKNQEAHRHLRQVARPRNPAERHEDAGRRLQSRQVRCWRLPLLLVVIIETTFLVRHDPPQSPPSRTATWHGQRWLAALPCARVRISARSKKTPIQSSTADVERERLSFCRRLVSWHMMSHGASSWSNTYPKPHYQVARNHTRGSPSRSPTSRLSPSSPCTKVPFLFQQSTWVPT